MVAMAPVWQFSERERGKVVTVANASRRAFMAALAGVGSLAFSDPAAAGRAIPVAGRLDGLGAGIIPDSDQDQTNVVREALYQAERQGAMLVLPPGMVRVRNLGHDGAIRMVGQPGTRLACVLGADYLLLADRGTLHLENIVFDGAGAVGIGHMEGLITVRNCPDVRISKCTISAAPGNALYLDGCSGLVENNVITAPGQAGIFTHGGLSMRITGNFIHDCGNNGILVWQPEKRTDGTVVSQNIIERIRADSGGDGPNGNGINVYRAANVKVLDNTIRQCAYSAVRNNSGDSIIIARNDCEDLGEVAIFVEFEFHEAVVSDNLIRDASAGISITNADSGGRMATVTGNLIRNVSPRISSPDVLGYGISVEEQTAVTGNVVEGASFCGLWIGWGRYLKTVTATGNILRNCSTGIAISWNRQAGSAVITGNLIESPEEAAIQGFDHARPVTRDLTRPDVRVPERLIILANRVER